MTDGRGDDRRLLAAVSYAARGDRDALSYLFCRFAGDVCASLLSMTDDARAAEELMRSLFADLPEALADYEPEVDGPFRSWLLETGREIADDRHRRA